MREIKFRAWFGRPHYSEPHMAYLDINDDFGGASATWQLRYLQHPEPDGPIYMQYTGLKDKNGVEIYEGDIIKFAYDDYLTIVEPMDTGRYSAFWSFADFKDPADEELGTQVIGNIYENSELLNGNKK